MGAPIFITALYELDNPHPYTIQTVKSDMDQQSESNDPGFGYRSHHGIYDHCKHRVQRMKVDPASIRIIYGVGQ